jgi:hypothetical protein
VPATGGFNVGWTDPNVTGVEKFKTMFESEATLGAPCAGVDDAR